MMSISNSSIFLRWQSSLPLAKAHERLGSHTLRRQASNAPTILSGVFASAALVVRSLHKVRSAEDDKTSEKLNKLTDAMRDGSDAISMLRSFILKKLASGEYQAIGFEIGSAAHEPPVEISPRFFRREWVKWEKDEIRSNDHAFDNVRIDLRNSLEKIAARPKVLVKSLNKAIGRPTVLNKILPVADELNRRGLLAGLTSKQREYTIRDECRKLYPLVFPKLTTPSRPKIYEALKQLGLMK